MSQVLCITIEKESTGDLHFFSSYNLRKRKFALMRYNTDSLQPRVDLLLPIKPPSVEHAIRVLIRKQTESKRWAIFTYNGTKVQLITKFFKNSNIQVLYLPYNTMCQHTTRKVR